MDGTKAARKRRCRWEEQLSRKWGGGNKMGDQINEFQEVVAANMIVLRKRSEPKQNPLNGERLDEGFVGNGKHAGVES